MNVYRAPIEGAPVDLTHVGHVVSMFAYNIEIYTTDYWCVLFISTVVTVTHSLAGSKNIMPSLALRSTRIMIEEGYLELTHTRDRATAEGVGNVTHTPVRTHARMHARTHPHAYTQTHFLLVIHTCAILIAYFSVHDSLNVLFIIKMTHLYFKRQRII